MEIIRSLDNGFVKQCAALKDKKGRDAFGQFIVEGLRSVSDTLLGIKDKSGIKVLLSESFYAAHPDAFANYDRAILEDRAFNKAADTVKTQGVAAVLPIPRFIRSYEEPLCLFLDGIRDPGNMGAILRTALSAGFTAVYAFSCCDPYNPKSVRSAMSAAGRVKIFEADGDELDKLVMSGYTLVSGSLTGENALTARFTDEKYCLLIGSEATGISDDAKRRPQRCVTIPMQGGIESLNAAVSAGILMYRIAEHRLII